MKEAYSLKMLKTQPSWHTVQKPQKMDQHALGVSLHTKNQVLYQAVSSKCSDIFSHLSDILLDKHIKHT
jgi:hypothetical protein